MGFQVVLDKREGHLGQLVLGLVFLAGVVVATTMPLLWDLSLLVSTNEIRTRGLLLQPHAIPNTATTSKSTNTNSTTATTTTTNTKSSALPSQLKPTRRGQSGIGLDSSCDPHAGQSNLGCDTARKHVIVGDHRNGGVEAEVTIGHAIHALNDFSLARNNLKSEFESQPKDSGSKCKSNRMFVVEPPYVCIFKQVVAVAALSEVLEITPQRLSDDWVNSYAMILLRPTSKNSFFPEFGALSNLQYVFFESALSGDIPESFWQLPNLSFLFIINSVEITGTLSEDMSQLPSIKTFFISETRLHGTIPESFYQLSTLQTLDVSSNNFTGTISTHVSQLSSLNHVVFDGNGFSGTLPSQLGLLTLLYSLTLSSNKISGTIPSQLGLLTLLTILDLSGNQLVGTLPPQLASLTLLTQVELGDNKLKGTIPAGYTKLTALTNLSIQGNNLEGTVPPALEALQRLDCDYSGLASLQCAKDCQSCALGELEITKCDSRGSNQKCVAGYVFLPITFAFVTIIALILRFISPPISSRAGFATEVLMSSFAAADMLTDITFAMNTKTKPIFISSGTLLVVIFVVNFCISVLVLSQAATDVGVDGRFSNPRFRKRVYQRPAILVTAVLFCIVNLRCLPFVISGRRSKQLREAEVLSYGKMGLRPIVGLLTVCIEDIPQFVIQVTAYTFNHEKNLIVVVSLAVTIMSVVIECMSVFFKHVVRHAPTSMFTPAVSAMRRLTTNSSKSSIVTVAMRKTTAVLTTATTTTTTSAATAATTTATQAQGSLVGYATNDLSWRDSQNGQMLAQQQGKAQQQQFSLSVAAWNNRDFESNASDHGIVSGGVGGGGVDDVGGAGSGVGGGGGGGIDGVGADVDATADVSSHDDTCNHVATDDVGTDQGGCGIEMVLVIEHSGD